MPIYFFQCTGSGLLAHGNARAACHQADQALGSSEDCTAEQLSAVKWRVMRALQLSWS